MIQQIESLACPDPNDLANYSMSREAREDVYRLEGVLRRINLAGKGQRRAVIAQIAREFGHLRGYDEKSLYRKHALWLAHDRARCALINRSMQDRLLGKTKVYQLYKFYCEKNQRGSRAAHREMIEDLCSGKSLPFGVGTWAEIFRSEHKHAELPVRCPYSLERPPRGWTYGRLQQVAGLTQFEKKATRLGLQAARENVLPVLTTRAGLHLGQYIQFDDKWDDIEVNFEGQSKGVRPLEFVARDVLSTSVFARGIRPRLVDEETGRRENLNERELRFMAAFIMTEVGVYKGGCVFVLEHRTAAIGNDFFERVDRIQPGLVRPERSAILAEQVHAGMWHGREGGNFRFKAMLESLHGLEHNALAMLPGQLGKSAAECPEQLKHLSAYNVELIKAAALLSDEERNKLAWPLLPFGEFVAIASKLYDYLEDRKWHTLEGWEESGFMVSEFRVNANGDWYPMAMLDTMERLDRAATEALLRAKPELMRVRRMSPREVRAKYAHELTTLPLHHIPDLLRRDDGFATRVEHDGTIQFKDRYLGPGVHIFHAAVKTPAGFMQSLTPGREVWAHSTPYQQDKLFISDASSGSIIGVAPRYERAARYDLDAVHRLMGAQAHHRKELSEPIRARHAGEAAERLALVEHNTTVLSGATTAPKQGKQSIDINEELRLERELLEKKGD